MKSSNEMEPATGRTTVSLAGRWQFALDESNSGIRECWFARALPETMNLPGTTDEAGYGECTNECCTDRLARVRRWIGPAWYQREVIIPAAWDGKQIQLSLERTKDSQVWVDEQWVGSDDSLSTPHEFDLTEQLTPGTHRLTILVDNAKLPPVGPCHQVDERTQTNWNGILGRIELCVTEPIWIRDVHVHPDPAARVLQVKAEVVNALRWSGAANFTWRVQALPAAGAAPIASVTTGMLLKQEGGAAGATIPLPEEIGCWDEFAPACLQVQVELSVMPVATEMRDTVTVTCGLRDFSTARGQFVINDRPTLLRGRVDSACFPLTGYAPMQKAEWVRLLGIAKEYGLNHYRFHSWCPPRAAFEAADELGLYLLVELPNKREITAPGNRDYKPPAEAYETLDELEGDGGPPAIRTAYLLREGERILRHYGNHPSFVMLTLGNELGGDEEVMREMCAHFRQRDTRHLYAMGSGHFHWDLGLREGDDFWVTRATGKGLYMRGASFESKCHIDYVPPSTTVDYQASIQGVPVPVIGHEIAEFEVYPDYREIKKYSGVLRARNFEAFRARLRAAGMLEQAHDFFRASGALSVICHREDIEAHLRTPGEGGFHMLDLMDFSGQGTALVGILDVFMDSKGLIRPERWREFCCETVPLLWMQKYTWTQDETFRARIRLAQYGPRDLENQVVVWSLRAGKKVLAKGETQAATYATGTVHDVDLIQASLQSVRKAQKLELLLALKGTVYRNRYDLWVYPAKQKPRAPKGVRVARTWGRKLEQELEQGGDVLLLPKRGSLPQTVSMAFQTGFWSPMFRMGGRKAPDGNEVPGTQGILCDPKHPLFLDFPTEFHGNWQWWQLVKHSDPMILDKTPAGFRPLLQVIDGIDRNHKLGLILEARVGKGRLLVCTIDLLSLQAHPEARQLLDSLYRYCGRSTWKPPQALSLEELRAVLHTTA